MTSSTTRLDFEARRVRAAVSSRLFGHEPAETTIGRFAVEARIGAGAMGVVYRAFDPTLDRRVAIKLVPGERRDRDRLLGEARALAQITDRNIIAVFDAGSLDDAVFIATELIDGVSARGWLEAEPRSRDQVLDVFLAAGRGLAAAHDAGVIHRDFKPDNIAVGDDGRVCVVDFGLAEARQAGAGTPAYMAPEQRSGEGDARSDQFSFCVALHEALAGERPFSGETVEELGSAIDAGPPPLEAPVHIAAAVRRGLAASPGDRFPDMRALLVTLERDPRRRRRRLIAGGLAAAVVFATGAIVATRLSAEPSWSERCDASAALVADRVWSPATPISLHRSFVATGHPAFARRADESSAGLARYAAEVADAQRSACRAAHVEGRQSEDVLDLRSSCVERRAAGASALASLLITSSDRELVASAPLLVDRLERLSDCDDVEWLSGVVRLPVDSPIAAEVAAQNETLRRVSALTVAGRFADALTALEPVLIAAERLGFAPLIAEAAYYEGDLLDRTDKNEKASERMSEAIRAAAAAGDRRLEVRAWNNLLWIVGMELERREEAKAIELSAEAAVLGAGKPAALAAQLDMTRANLRIQSGDVAEAEKLVLPHFEAARAGNAPGGDPTRALRMMADIRFEQGRYPEGAELNREVADIAARRWPGSPREAASLESLGLSLRKVGEHEEAVAAFRQVLEIREINRGPAHSRTAVALSNLGAALADIGRFEEAESLAQRAYEIARAKHEGDHPAVASQLNDLASVQHRSRNFEAAAKSHGEALRIREATLGADHFLVGLSASNLADTMAELGRFDESLRLARRAVGIFEDKFGSKHVNLSYPLINIGSALLGAGRPGDAIAPIERAIALRSAAGVGPDMLARPRFTLAQAQWRAGKRASALASARAAQAEASKAGAAAADVAAELARWLESR